MLVEIKVALLVEVPDETDMVDESLNTRDLTFKLVSSESETSVDFKCLDMTDIECKPLEVNVERIKADRCASAQGIDLQKNISGLYLQDRIQIVMQKELEEQKAAGKQFLTNENIDQMIGRILKEELP